MYKEPRRKDRTIPEEEARAILDRGEYGILATVDADGQPYALPISYILHNGSLYIHCGLKGHKVDNLAADSRVSFCVVGPTEPVMHPKGFSTYYESCVVFSTARMVSEPAEKHEALYALTRKYFPNEDESIRASIKQMDAATLVYAVSIDNITGKAKR